MKQGYLIDMDGVLYRGPELIPGADRFIHQLRERDIPFLFLTNNSQRTRRDVVARLARMGLEVEDRHVFTSAMATARFLEQQKPGGTAYVIGEGGLLTALHQHGYAVVDHDPDYVVVGEGRTFNLELVEAAVRMILGGGRLMAPNMSQNCPTQKGRRPGRGVCTPLAVRPARPRGERGCGATERAGQHVPRKTDPVAWVWCRHPGHAGGGPGAPAAGAGHVRSADPRPRPRGVRRGGGR